MADMRIVFRPNVLMWIILILAATNTIFIAGMRRSFGGFVAHLRRVYPNISLTELDWIGDSYAAFGHMTSSLSTVVIFYFSQRYRLFQMMGSSFVLAGCMSSAVIPNPHWLFLTFTFLIGMGSSIILATAGLIVNEYFPQGHPYRLLATTVVSGGSVASIIFVYVFSSIIGHFGWRHAFFVLGVIYFVVTTVPIFFLARPNTDHVEADTKHVKCRTITDAITIRTFPLLVLWFADRILTSMVAYGLLMNLTDFLHRNDDDLGRSSTLTLVLAAGEATSYIISAMVTGFTKTFFTGRIKYILAMSSAIMAATLIAIEFCGNSRRLLLFLCYFAGFGLGPSITFLFPAGEELTGLPGHVAYSFSLLGMGVGMLVSPLLSGEIIERYSYNWFFRVQGGLAVIKTICLVTIVILSLCGVSAINGPAQQKVIAVVDDDETTKLLANKRGKSTPTDKGMA